MTTPPLKGGWILQKAASGLIIKSKAMTNAPEERSGITTVSTRRFVDMREIKIRTPHYWMELPADLPVIDLARLLAKTKLRLRWNNRIKDCTGKRGFVELHHPQFSTYQ